MKKCKNCNKPVFACCGNEPGDYCHKCEEKLGLPSKTCELAPAAAGNAGSAGKKAPGRPSLGRKGGLDG